MKIYIIIALSIITLGFSNGFSQEGVLKPAQKNVELKWYSLEEAEKLNQTKPKKFLIDVYTDWCGWCKKMDKETFTNPVIAEYLAENFYTIKFNAETSDTIVFNGAKYVNLVKTGRSTHPLALSLLGWRMSYPSIVYFTEKLEFLGPMPGYKTPDQLEVIINFIGQDKFRTMSMEDYQKSFVSKIVTGK
jgi:thioredoxin-related protein